MIAEVKFEELQRCSQIEANSSSVIAKFNCEKGLYKVKCKVAFDEESCEVNLMKKFGVSPERFLQQAVGTNLEGAEVEEFKRVILTKDEYSNFVPVSFDLPIEESGGVILAVKPTCRVTLAAVSVVKIY